MIYKRLLDLYKKKNSDKTPLEDFTTEILVGTLERNEELLEDFVNNVLKIKGTSFNIESQVKYNLDDDINCIIDIVISNKNMLCFIENKVHSSEGERQLERYTKVLNNIKKSEGKEVFLRYCTKYHDAKEIDSIDFLQYRWSDVYKFLQNYDDDRMIEEYLEFLRGEGMDTAGDFNYQDLIVMSNISSTIAKMDECLDHVKEILTKEFGKPYERDYERLKQIVKDAGYTICTKGIVADEKSHISIGFIVCAEDATKTTVPFLCVDLCVNSQNPKYDQFKEKISELSAEFTTNHSTKEQIMLSYEKPLVDFISSENQINSITEWFKDRIFDVKKVINEI